MNSRSLVRAAIAASLGLAALLPLSAQAHRGWLLPSATVLSGDKAWVTVDAAVSNDLFYFEHQPMRLDNLKVYAPDGKLVQPANPSTGRYRSTFDVQLSQQGTYRISVENDSANASFKVGEEVKRVRGTLESLRKDIPADAKNVSVSRNQSRLDIFVTAGKPTDVTVKPTGKGLELVAKTHPNDLFVGDKANFALTIDGKPAANVPVTLIRGGIRYRDQLAEIKTTTAADGSFSVTWPEPGMYWMNASYPPRPGDDEDEGPGASGVRPQGATGGQSGPGAGAGRREPQGGTLDAPAVRASYTATLEVLPQ